MHWKWKLSETIHSNTSFLYRLFKSTIRKQFAGNRFQCRESMRMHMYDNTCFNRVLYKYNHRVNDMAIKSIKATTITTNYYVWSQVNEIHEFFIRPAIHPLYNPKLNWHSEKISALLEYSVECFRFHFHSFVWFEK